MNAPPETAAGKRRRGTGSGGRGIEHHVEPTGQLDPENKRRLGQVLRELSVQTAESTHATAQAIIKMADLAGELRKSIAGFRLPAVTSQNPVLPVRAP